MIATSVFSRRQWRNRKASTSRIAELREAVMSSLMRTQRVRGQGHCARCSWLDQTKGETPERRGTKLPNQWRGKIEKFRMFGSSELRVRCARKDNTRGTCRGTWHKALDRYHQGSFLSTEILPPVIARYGRLLNLMVLVSIGKFSSYQILFEIEAVERWDSWRQWKRCRDSRGWPG